MKEYLLKKKIYAVTFFIVLFSFSIVNFIHSYEPLKDFLKNEKFQGVSTVTKLEQTINENLCGRMSFIEGYGFVQTLLDKKEINNFNYILDEKGYLHYVSFFKEDDSRIFEYAMRLKRLQDSVAAKGTKVLFVICPSKSVPGETEFRTGMPLNDPNPSVNELLFYLNRLGVETLDLRESIPNDELSYEETFFKTDHHWTIPATFHATGELVDKIEESFGRDLDPENQYTDISNYEVLTYKKGMLGSMGRKTGVLYGGIDDFTAIWPKYEGHFYREYCYYDTGELESIEGDVVKALMNTNILKKDNIYSDSQYSLYLNGITNYERITNYDNPDGPSIFMIRDSYFSPVMVFMAPMCSKIEAIWTLEETETWDVEKCLQEGTYDYVIMEIYPYNIEDKAFNFFKESVTNGE